MDINFQSGEFYNDPDLLSTVLNVVASLLGALISAWIAIWIFNKGNKNQRVIENEKETKRLKETKIYFETLVNLLIDEPIERQRTEILKFTNKLKQDKFQHYEMQVMVGLSLEYIKKVEHKDLFKIYVSDKDVEAKTKIFQKLVTELDLITAIKENLQEHYNNFFSDYKRFEGDFQTNAENVIKLFTKEISDALANGIQLNQDAFLASMQAQIIAWKNLENDATIDDHRDPYIVKQHLLVPLLELCNNNQNDRRAPVLGAYIRAALFALENFNELRTFFRKAFLFSARHLVRARVRIVSYLKQLN